jgi:hypothetical protein
VSLSDEEAVEDIGRAVLDKLQYLKTNRHHDTSLSSDVDLEQCWGTAGIVLMPLSTFPYTSVAAP